MSRVDTAYEATSASGATEIAGLDNDGRLTVCGVFGLLQML